MIFTVRLPWYHGDDPMAGAKIVADNAEESVTTWAGILDDQAEYDVLPCDTDGHLVYVTDEDGNVTRVRVMVEMRPQYHTSTVSDDEEN